MGHFFDHFGGTGSYRFYGFYVLDTSLLADYTDYVYLPHSASLFSLLMSFNDQKFLILMSTNLSISPFIVSAFGVFFKKMHGYLKVMRLLCHLVYEVLFCLNLNV